jgi:cupin 2 domain-containing protein
LIHINNLYRQEEPVENSEIFSTLFQNNSFKIESIRSWLKTPGEIYNQEQDEWVVLIRGNSQLYVKEEIVNLHEGDSLFLPKHTPHQVLHTSKDALWLGVFSL